MKFSQNYGHLSAIYFYCFTHFVEQFLADFLLLILPLPSPLAQKAFLPRRYPFRPRRIALPGQNGRITQRSHDMRICYWAAQRACKGLLRLLAHAHSCVDTERLFSLERAFRAICTYCKRLYDDPVLSRSRFRALCARATLRTFRRTHSLRSGCICFAKMRRTFPLSKAQKARSSIIFLSKRLPYVVFWRLGVLAARRFVGARKQLPLFSYFIDSSGYRSARVANGCFCRYFGLSRVHRFFPRLRACFEK